MDGHLRPYASATGDIVWDFNTGRDYDTVNRQKAHGGLLEGEGPALAAGTEYAYSGYGQWAACRRTWCWPFRWTGSNGIPQFVI
ncbi:MAG: hypothetical protein WAM79_15215 [Candidatus Sulfotelmatobacter sp.]